MVGYDRRAALAERAIIPIRFGALDGEAEWLLEGERQEAGSFRDAGDRLRPMLFTALRTGYADAVLHRAFADCRDHRARRRGALGLGPSEGARGLGKLLVVAPDQATARAYSARLRAWLGSALAVALAISDERDAVERIARFRLRPHPSVLVTLGMAYEGLDAPEISHVACLTQVRSVPWLEQMVARATRFDPHGGPYGAQRAVIYHPDDPLFRRFRRAIELEQAGRARARRRDEQAELDLGEDEAQDSPAWHPRLEPLRSLATELHFETVQPRRAAAAEGLPSSWAGDPAATETPSQAEHRLRRQVGQMIAAQVVEDGEAGHAESGHHAYHGYNAALKRLFGKPRAAMSLAELEAMVGWLERNRMREHLGLLEGDHRYSWVAQVRRRVGARRRGGARFGSVPGTGG